MQRQQWLRDYFHRIYPLQSLLLLTRSLRPKSRITGTIENVFDKERGIEQLSKVFTALTAYREKIGDRQEEGGASGVLMKTMGFCLEKKQSGIPKAGNGIFLNGTAQPGDIVSLYPGAIYMPGDPILLSSFRNRYILRCVDGIFIDGKSTGLSRWLYMSLWKRNNYPGALERGDCSWMTDRLINPLAVGQIINNGTSEFPPNVSYQELDLSPSFPASQQCFLPNIYHIDIMEDEPIRVVVLVALRKIRDEELFSNYFEIV